MSRLAEPTEYEWEPVPGLPARPPEGETILWRGSPRWRSLAIRAFHVRKVAIYFAVLMVWRIAAAQADGLDLSGTLAALLQLGVVGAVALGLLTLLAWLYARTTIFTVTNRRVVLRYGVALPMAINLPFRQVQTAAMRSYADGSGDIVLQLKGPDRISYLHLWPFARPWRVAQPEPALRCIPDAPAVAALLSTAMAAATGGFALAPAAEPAPDKVQGVEGRAAGTGTFAPAAS